MGIMDNSFICQHCGANITEDMIYCEYCGCQISSSQPKAPQKIVINNYYSTPEKTIIYSETPNISYSPVTGKKAKDKYVSLLLCIFLGYFGAHKFYEGKKGLGILYLCTYGLFGFGWIIDIFSILAKPNPYYV